ncbi:hypothetical protein J2R96_004833 [Bradyrhizobium elkanii]|nr:hypothetical protein [Bradyrhizobium elkanii]
MAARRRYERANGIEAKSSVFPSTWCLARALNLTVGSREWYAGAGPGSEIAAAGYDLAYSASGPPDLYATARET